MLCPLRTVVGTTTRSENIRLVRAWGNRFIFERDETAAELLGAVLVTPGESGCERRVTYRLSIGL